MDRNLSFNSGTVNWSSDSVLSFSTAVGGLDASTRGHDDDIIFSWCRHLLAFVDAIGIPADGVVQAHASDDGELGSMHSIDRARRDAMVIISFRC